MSERKCTFKGCDAVGEPSPGYDFYACEDCLEELDVCIQELQEQQVIAAIEKASRN